jgi:hypothetical protein
MKMNLFLLTILMGFGFTAVLHAEGGCPAGMIPYSGTDISSCGPMPPGYYQQLPSQAPTASPLRWESRWGAIATDGTKGILGAATDAADKLSAEKKAMADCLAKGGLACKIQVSYANGCAAMIVGNRGFSTANGSTEDEAIRKSTKICSADGDTGCRIYYIACSHPQRIQ